MIPSLINILQIDCGYEHIVCVDTDGSVFSFGGNSVGQLGVCGDVRLLNSTHIPQKVDIPPCKQVSCGRNFTICVSIEGEIYSFGDNYQGNLGLGNIMSCNLPHKIDSLKNVDFVTSGFYHTICKTDNNEIFVWGRNEEGELGIENSISQIVPFKCDIWPNHVVDIKCGCFHTLVLTENGDLFSCGSNEDAQLGRLIDGKFSSSLQKIDNIPEISRIECGHYHSMCIDINGNLLFFGGNSCGQFGLGDTDKRDILVQHPSLSNIIDISSKGEHVFVKTSNNEIYAFGSNDNSQLGIKTEDINQITPIRVFEDIEDIWCSTIGESKAKSARK